MQSRQLIQILEADGWFLLRISGSHHIFRHTQKQGIVVVPHPKKDLPAGTVKSIKKQAGL